MLDKKNHIKCKYHIKYTVIALSIVIYYPLP